jgi:hypothetical protein
MSASTSQSQLEPWERIAVLLVTFAVACSGFATVLYGIGFLINAVARLP